MAKSQVRTDDRPSNSPSRRWTTTKTSCTASSRNDSRTPSRRNASLPRDKRERKEDKREREEDSDEGTMHTYERSFGQFSRAFSLPDSADVDKIRALGWTNRTAFEDGLRRTIDWFVANDGWWRAIRAGEFEAFYERQYGERLAGAGGR